MNNYYPMLIDLTSKDCLIVGGGKVAERKIKALFKVSANITVVSLHFTPAISTWSKEGRLRIVCKPYSSHDSENMFLVIAATNDEKVNSMIYEDALLRNQLVNIIDQPEKSNFISPAVFSRGKLQITVSTHGASPALAKEIARDLEKTFGIEYEVYLDFLHEYRLIVKKHVNDLDERKQLYQDMLQKDILQLIRNGQFEAFRLQALQRFGGSYEKNSDRY